MAVLRHQGSKTVVRVAPKKGYTRKVPRTYRHHKTQRPANCRTREYR